MNRPRVGFVGLGVMGLSMAWHGMRIAADAGLDMPLARANQALWHDQYFTNICRNF